MTRFYKVNCFELDRDDLLSLEAAVPGLLAEDTLLNTPLEQLGSADDGFMGVYRLALRAYGSPKTATDWLTRRRQLEMEIQSRRNQS